MKYGLDTKVVEIDEHLLNKLSQFQLQKRVAFGSKNLDLPRFLGSMMSQ